MVGLMQHPFKPKDDVTGSDHRMYTSISEESGHNSITLASKVKITNMERIIIVLIALTLSSILQKFVCREFFLSALDV